MKHLIRINRNSVRLNKNHGSCSTMIAGSLNIEFSAKKLPDCFIDGKNCIIQTWECTNYGREIDGVNDNSKVNCTGVILSDDLLDMCVENKFEGVTINMKRGMNRIYHQPIPKYSFEYEDSEVQCCECGETFKRSELLHDEIDDYYSLSVCPKCGEFDCCELEYEKINDVIKSLK